MKLNSTRLSLIAGAVLASGFLTVVPALAHHSFEAEFDGDKTATVTGVVTKIDWTNPHAWVYMNIKDEAGATKTFAVELGPPYALVRNGWKRDTVKIGDTVTVQGAAMAKDGSSRAGSLPSTRMMLTSGEKLPMR
ncbi:MAG TPA: DUF6152 family protein [Bryobacteraceae bacterium]|nr:DUF6152 family protein [Bryobacteraceae bacterium]